MARVVQISDTHLSRRRAYFLDNWEVVLDHLADDPPALAILTGDVSFNGSDEDDDLAFARQQIERLPCPYRVLPGNHDIGEHPLSGKNDQPINETRYRRWMHHFGSDRFVTEMGGWALIGIDSELLGSGLPAEAEQWTWLEDKLEVRGETPVALFMHRPAFALMPDEAADYRSFIDPAARMRLLALIRAHRVRSVATGHLHGYRRIVHAGTDFVWAPGTSFVVPNRRAELGVVNRSAILEWRFESGGADHALVEPPLLINLDFSNWFRTAGSTVQLPPLEARTS